MIKKVNAVLSFITAALSLVHVILMGLLLCGRIPFNPAYNKIGIVLLIIFSVHAILSIGIMFFKSGNGLKYPKLNKSTVEQRIAAILLLLFIHFHTKAYFVNGAIATPDIRKYILEFLFSIIIMSHFMPSLDKGLITLGINNKPTVIAVKIIALFAFVFSLVTVSVYFLGAIV